MMDLKDLIGEVLWILIFASMALGVIIAQKIKGKK